jgi:hypothetical protein
MSSGRDGCGSYTSRVSMPPSVRTGPPLAAAPAKLITAAECLNTWPHRLSGPPPCDDRTWAVDDGSSPAPRPAPANRRCRRSGRLASLAGATALIRANAVRAVDQPVSEGRHGPYTHARTGIGRSPAGSAYVPSRRGPWQPRGRRSRVGVRGLGPDQARPSTQNFSPRSASSLPSSSRWISRTRAGVIASVGSTSSICRLVLSS